MAQKDLHTLIRVQKWEVDERRRALGALMREEDKVIARIEQLEGQHKKEQDLAREQPHFALHFGNYVEVYLEKREKLEDLLKAIRIRIEQARDAVADAFRQLKTYEISQENRDKEAAIEEARKEQTSLDEIGLNLHRRRQEDEKEQLSQDDE